jgi:mRNA-degrading endonuclease RelE of RelBE toxin-antitoxin system
VNLILSSTFTKSLARLTAQEQKIAKLAAFDLQMNPSKPGFSFERLNNPKDPGFWSARVNSDIRVIAHRNQDHVALCYVGHHDDAYRWGERRRYEVHPVTGAAQIVEVVERTEEVVHRTVKEEQVEPPVFRHRDEEYILSLGVPRTWLDAVMTATDHNILDILRPWGTSGTASVLATMEFKERCRKDRDSCRARSPSRVELTQGWNHLPMSRSVAGVASAAIIA